VRNSLGVLFRQAFLDGKKGSFGRLSALPFLLSAWFVATFQGVRMVLADQDALEVVWTLALIASLLYGGSKGFSVARDFAMRRTSKVPDIRENHNETKAG